MTVRQFRNRVLYNQTSPHLKKKRGSLQQDNIIGFVPRSIALGLDLVVLIIIVTAIYAALLYSLSASQYGVSAEHTSWFIRNFDVGSFLAGENSLLSFGALVVSLSSWCMACSAISKTTPGLHLMGAKIISLDGDGNPTMIQVTVRGLVSCLCYLGYFLPLLIGLLTENGRKYRQTLPDFLSKTIITSVDYEP